MTGNNRKLPLVNLILSVEKLIQPTYKTNDPMNSVKLRDLIIAFHK